MKSSPAWVQSVHAPCPHRNATFLRRSMQIPHRNCSSSSSTFCSRERRRRASWNQTNINKEIKFRELPFFRIYPELELYSVQLLFLNVNSIAKRAYLSLTLRISIPTGKTYSQLIKYGSKLFENSPFIKFVLQTVAGWGGEV